jgi:ABC-2 type transport system permease protein
MSTVAGVRPPPVLAAGRPGPGRLLVDQSTYAGRELWRSRVALIFTFLLPLVWLVLIGIMAGNDAVDSTTGVRVMQFVTPTAAVIGMLFAAYPPTAYSLGQAREQGILKRLAGTPLPSWAYLVGRAAAAFLLALAAVVVMLLVGVIAYDVQVIWRTLPATIVTVSVGIVSFTMLGLAVGAIAPSASAAQSIATGTAVAAAFASGLFTIGLQIPEWLDALAGLLPVQPLATALKNQFNPFLEGNGWDLEALAMMAAWGVAGLLVAVWALRRTSASVRAVASEPAPASGTHGAASVRHAGVGRFGMLVDQVWWATRASLRDAGVVFFAVAMPVGLYTLMAASYPNGGLDGAGRPFVFVFACSMTVYGIAVLAFINNPESVATARDRRVLKRLRGTPLESWQYLAGRTAAVLWLGAVVAVLVFGVAIAFFGVRVAGVDGLMASVLVLLLGTLTLAACGYALVSVTTSRRAVATAGLAILLPLAFFSDIFVVGSVPDWVATVGSLFPLRHFVHALIAALDPAGLSIQGSDLAVMAAWLVGASIVAIRRFRWEPVGPTSPDGRPRRGFRSHRGRRGGHRLRDYLGGSTRRPGASDDRPGTPAGS